MAYQYSGNNTPTTFAQYIYILKTVMVAAGWTVMSSSDGTTYNSSGDQITTATLMDSAGAWFRIRMPSVSGITREICFQRSTTPGSGASNSWRITYSYSVGFTTGSPGATRVPTATDSKTVLGSGTDASPTFISTWMTGTQGSQRMHAAADNASPYAVWAAAYTGGTGVPSWAFILDPLIANSYPAADVDPYVFYCGSNNAFSGIEMSASTPTAGSFFPQCFFKKGLSGEGFVGIGYAYPTACGVANDLGTMLGTEPYASKDVPVPVAWCRPVGLTAPIGWKGYSSVLTARSVARATGQTNTLVTTSDGIVIGNFILPWNGTTPIV